MSNRTPKEILGFAAAVRENRLPGGRIQIGEIQVKARHAEIDPLQYRRWTRRWMDRGYSQTRGKSTRPPPAAVPPQRHFCPTPTNFNLICRGRMPTISHPNATP